MKKPNPNWPIFCEHANEVPNVCPCPATCGCRYYHCKKTALVEMNQLEVAKWNDELHRLLGPTKLVKIKVDFRTPEQKMAASIKVGQKFRIFIPVSETHELRVFCRVTAKRKVKIK